MTLVSRHPGIAHARHRPRHPVSGPANRPPRAAKPTLLNRLILPPRRYEQKMTKAELQDNPNIASMALCLCLGLLSAGCGPLLATRADDVAHMPNPMLNANYSEDAEVPFVMEPRTAVADGSRQADFASESASRRTREMADWVVSSRDNLNMPFAIVDKVNAKVYVFEVDGKLTRRGARAAWTGARR